MIHAGTTPPPNARKTIAGVAFKPKKQPAGCQKCMKTAFGPPPLARKTIVFALLHCKTSLEIRDCSQPAANPRSKNEPSSVLRVMAMPVRAEISTIRAASTTLEIRFIPPKKRAEARHSRTPRWRYDVFHAARWMHTGCGRMSHPNNSRYINRPTLEKRVFCGARKKQA